MSQYIQFQQVVVNGVVIKVGRHRAGGHIIGRMLNGGEGVDVLPVGQNDDTARMLARGSSNPHTALDNPVNLTVALPVSPLLIVILHIAVSRLVRQRTDGARPVGLSFSKDNLRVVVGLTLVLTGEVQVDIRLLVSLEAQEGLKGDIVPVLHKRLPADRTQLIRHITAGHTGEFLHVLRVKVGVMTFGTVVMGTQRVYLGDTGHGSHKGGAHRTSGTNQIAVLIGLPHQLLGDDIHHGESVADDGI